MNDLYKISDFVTLYRDMGRKARAKCAGDQQANIYMWLKHKGYGQATVNGKLLVFRRKDDGIEPSSVISMKHAFLRFLERH